MKRLLLICFITLCSLTSSYPTDLVTRTWTVGELERQALVAVPASTDTTSSPTNKLLPVVFAFHGHGGSMQQASRSFGYHTIWPEAIIIYPHGLPTPGKLTDPEGKKNGWQSKVGDQDDRDLLFFDAMLQTCLNELHADPQRVYATGHSNGGGFTYLLGAARADKFAALAPSSAVINRPVNTFKPIPLLHVAGENDPLVKFTWQTLSITTVKRINGCETGKPWGDNQFCTEYESPTGTPLVTCIHPGDHKYFAEAPALIVKFFKQHQRTEKTDTHGKQKPTETSPTP